MGIHVLSFQAFSEVFARFHYTPDDPSLQSRIAASRGGEKKKKKYEIFESACSPGEMCVIL
jgi:hypothetical protein